MVLADLTSFADLLGRCRVDVVDPSTTAAAFLDLAARYGEPHRHYHTLDHVGWVLHHLETTASDLPDRRAVELAAWYHDVIFTGAPGDEQASADHASRVLGDAGCDATLLAAVGRLILATQRHQPERPDEAALCDADLAVLAAPPPAYERYRGAVRAEYAHVDDDAWRAGRAAVLRGLLDRPALFHTAAFARREAAARANLTAELATLAPGARR